MDPFPVPATPGEWAKLVGERSALGVSSIRSNTPGFNSRLADEDWLLLKILCVPAAGKPTHEAILGDVEGAKLKAAAQKSLENQPWTQALNVNSDDCLEWSTLAVWKQSFNSIRETAPYLKNPEGMGYDEANPYRLLVAPSGACPRPRLPSRQPSSHGSQTVSVTQSKGLAASPGTAVLSRYGDGASISRPYISDAPMEIVNMTLIQLLKGVCIPLLQQRSREPYYWSIVRKSFSVRQTDPDDCAKRYEIMSARTDGCLRATRPNVPNPDRDDVLAIVDVRHYRRRRSSERVVQMEEGAQMAAWISAESTQSLLPTNPETNKHRRVLISQDFDEVFITIAEYDDEYVQHMRGEDKDPRPLGSSGFLRMIQFEPFDLNNGEDLKALFPLIYSLTDYLTASDAARTAMSEGTS